ncbi:MAG: O-antigen ligase family protein [Cyanobacteriota bacterium]
MPGDIAARLAQRRPEGANPTGWICFQLGLVLLASSALLGGLLLLCALIQGSRRRETSWEDPANQVLLLAALLMVVSASVASSGWLAWVGLGNWLPFFWAFWGFQPYLATPDARRRVGWMLVAGTVPVVLTGFGQLFWGWSGPFQALNGAIIWHLKAGGNPAGRLAGLFDYANIAGSWLALAWPFTLAALVQPGLSRTARALILTMASSAAAAVLLTDSRNAWGALVLALPLVLGAASWSWLLPLLLLGLAVVAAATLPGMPEGVQHPARELVPEAIRGRLSDLRYSGHRPLAVTRLAQWGTSLELIGERPWLGWGAAAFSLIYPKRTGHWHGHPHNLPIDLALSHGLPMAVLVVGLVVVLLWRSARRGMATGALFDRAWWTAALVLVALHASDIPMYDSRINVAGWVVLAGLRAFLRDQAPTPTPAASVGSDVAG